MVHLGQKGPARVTLGETTPLILLTAVLRDHVPFPHRPRMWLWNSVSGVRGLDSSPSQDVALELGLETKV